MGSYIDTFNHYLLVESPKTVDMTIMNTQLHFEKINFENKKFIGKRKISECLARYYGGDNNKNYTFDIIHNYYNSAHGLNPDEFNRLEIRHKGDSSQITCIHYNDIGMTKGQDMVDFSQKIHFANRDGNNKKRLQLAREILEREGLLCKNNPQKWSLGRYSNLLNHWNEGMNFNIFIANFLKVAVIMDYIRTTTY